VILAKLLDLLDLQDQKDLLGIQEFLVKMVKKESVVILVTKDHKDYLEERGWMENADLKEILDSLDHLEMMDE